MSDLNNRIEETKLLMLEMVIEGHAYLAHHGQHEIREYHAAQANHLQRVYKQHVGHYYIKNVNTEGAK